MLAVIAPFAPPPRDRSADALLGEIPCDLFSEGLYLSCELVDRYALDWAIELVDRLGLADPLATGTTLDELMTARSFVPAGRPALDWILRRLASEGLLERSSEGSTARYRRAEGWRGADLEALRAIGLDLDPRNRPTLALLDAAAEAYPAILTGTITGEQALLSGARMQLWLDYFSNQNPVYALSNRLAAVAAANALPARSGLRLLEVGAGAGSAAEALLEELERRNRLADVAEYRLTEPNPFLRRRAMRGLTVRFPSVTLRDAGLDIDVAPAEQGIEAESFDLVFAVNVLHVARRLRESLTGLRAALVPGGHLVAGECLRLFPDQAVSVELVFRLMRGFNEVELEPGVRSSAGFLGHDEWPEALGAAGFTQAEVVPDLGTLRHHYTRFVAGAVRGTCGAASGRGPAPGDATCPS